MGNTYSICSEKITPLQKHVKNGSETITRRSAKLTLAERCASSNELIINSAQIWHVWYKGSHSFTCHQTKASRTASPPFDRYSLRLPTDGWPGSVDLGGWLDRDKFPAPGVEPPHNHHPSTNRARRTATSLIWPTSLQTTPNRHYRTKFRLRLPLCKHFQFIITVYQINYLFYTVGHKYVSLYFRLYLHDSLSILIIFMPLETELNILQFRVICLLHCLMAS